MPQSTAQLTLCTRMLLSSSTETSAACAMMLPNDSCIARPRARPFGSAFPQPAFSAAVLSARKWRGLSSSSAARNSSGSRPAAQASSSTMLSMANAVCVLPTDRHHSTVTGVLGECSVTRRWGTFSRYGESDTPSTEVLSMPFFTSIGSNGVPARIDWPTMVCFQPAGRPFPSSEASMRWRNCGR